MSKDDFMYDVRVISRNLKEGLISKKDLKSHLKDLPNAEEKSEVLQVEEDIVEEETIEEVEEIEQTD